MAAQWHARLKPRAKRCGMVQHGCAFNTSTRDSGLSSSSAPLRATASCVSLCRGREERAELFRGLKEIAFGGLPGEGGVAAAEVVEGVVAEVGKLGDVGVEWGHG